MSKSIHEVFGATASAWKVAVENKKLKLLTAEETLPEKSTQLPAGYSEDDTAFIHTDIKSIKNLKDYLCIVFKGRVLSKKEIPILFNKQTKDFCRNVAYEQEGNYPFKHTFIRRADKCIKALYKLGFTPEHKVAIFTLKTAKDKIINQSEKVMPRSISSIEIIWNDNTRKVVANPTGKVLEAIIEDIAKVLPFDGSLEKVDTHIVYKREYFKNAPSSVHVALVNVDNFYINQLTKKGKKPGAKYIVINQDEPYASKILSIILAEETIKLKEECERKFKNVKVNTDADETPYGEIGTERNRNDNNKGREEDASADHFNPQ